MTKRPKTSGFLSNKQNARLGGLIAVLGGREPYDWILGGLVQEGFVERVSGSLVLTNRGVKEKDRLATLAGLMVEKDKAAPLPPKSTERLPCNPTDQRPPDALGDGQNSVRKVGGESYSSS